MYPYRMIASRSASLHKLECIILSVKDTYMDAQECMHMTDYSKITSLYHHDTEERTDHRCGIVFQSQRHRNIPRQAAQSDTCRQLAGRSRAGKNGNHAIGAAQTRIGSPGRFLFENPHFPQVKSRENPSKMPLFPKEGRRSIYANRAYQAGKDHRHLV